MISIRSAYYLPHSILNIAVIKISISILFYSLILQ